MSEKYFNQVTEKIEEPVRMRVSRISEGQLASDYVLIAGSFKRYASSEVELMIQFAKDLRNHQGLVELRVGFDYDEKNILIQIYGKD